MYNDSKRKNPLVTISKYFSVLRVESLGHSGGVIYLKLKIFFKLLKLYVSSYSQQLVNILKYNLINDIFK